MVDWSKYDGEARSAVEGEREAAKDHSRLLQRLEVVTRHHVDRLVAAEVPAVDKENGHIPLWRLDGLQRDGQALGDFYVTRAGTWHAYVSKTFTDYDFSMRYEVQKQGVMLADVACPILDEDVLALELAKHYVRVTGG